MGRKRGELVLTSARLAYLAAFEHWLLTAWAPGTEGLQHDGALELKDACFEAVLLEPSQPRR